MPVSRHSPVLFLVRSIKGNFLTNPHWHQQPLATPSRDVSHVPSLGHCFQLALHRTLVGLAMYLSLPASPADIGEDFFHRFPLRWVHLTFAFYTYSADSRALRHCPLIWPGLEGLRDTGESAARLLHTGDRRGEGPPAFSLLA